jgi:hypothetical protein
MANIMGILGGLGQGVSAGVQDLERMEDAKFRKEQQQREREKIAEEKRIAEQIKGIQAETPEERDVSGEFITKPAQKLSRAQMLARQADIYSSSPDRATAAYGLQLSQAARGEQEAEDFQTTKAKYADARKLLNTDLEKFQQTYPALFNADKIGGPETKGMIMAPMSTSKGTVYNVMTPQGQSVMQLPVDKQSLGRALDAMYYSELANINPKYAELVMKQEELGMKREGLGLQREGLDIRRLEGESDAEYRRRMAATAEAREARETKTTDAQIRGGMFSRAPGQFKPLGLGNEGDAIFGVQDGVGKTIPIPKGFSGSFPSLTPKKPRDEVEKAWLDTESALIKNGEKPDLIRQQQTAFYARRGVAPPAAEDAMLQGYVLDSKGKQKPLTADDIKEFNRRYPKSAVKPEDLPWYKK